MQQLHTNKELKKLTEQVVDTTLLIGTFLGIILYLLRLLNYKHVGFRISFVTDLFVISILAVITIKRKKLSINFKSIVVIISLFLLFIIDTIELGATSENHIFIILIPFYSFLVYPLRKVIYLYTGIVIVFLSLGILFNLGYLKPSVDLNSHVLLFNTWMLNIFTTTIISAAVILIMYYFNQKYDYLINNLQKANQKPSEQELYYKEIFDSTSCAIFLYSLEGKMLDVNDTMLKMYGYSSREEVFNTNIKEFSNEQENLIVKKKEKDFEALLNGKHLSFDWKAKKKDGTPFWVNIDVKQVKIGNEKRILSLVKDITKQKEDEIQLNLYRNHLKELIAKRTKELEEANKELKITNKKLESQKKEVEAAFTKLKNMQHQLIQSEKMASLGLLAAGLAHEINNPLNFIQGSVFGIENYLTTNLQEHYENLIPLFEGIKEGIQRASGIVTGLNHYSRSDELQKEACNIHSIIDGGLVMLRNKIKGRIEVIKHYTEEKFVLIANEGKLHQVMVNVLLNAVQSIKEKGKIKIITETDNKYLLIKVIDNGHGISNENMDKIFDPFFTTKEIGEGTGLGMSISLQIIQDHKGEITYESEEGKGTKVIIKLPIEQKKIK